ncbi:MAG: cyanophycinase [Ignavibacteriales bacterium]
MTQLISSIQNKENELPGIYKGHLLIIGGGPRPAYLMHKFIRLAGGMDSGIVIIPMASQMPLETAKRHKQELELMGCTNVSYINCSRDTADCDQNLEILDNAKGVFFTGGDQNKLSAHLKGTHILEKIKKIYADGGVIGGTSAGAAVMSKIMICGDGYNDSDVSPYLYDPVIREHVKLSQGFGFIENVIIDQHFNTRDRKLRLINAVLEHPELSGVGIDESTAIVVDPLGSFEVIGENHVMVFNSLPSDNHRQSGRKYITTSDIRITRLRSGDKYANAGNL